ncbi:hypothetical protein ONZ45_g6725 [Pleurotus djamor]|nr:hypothetical protein ONZ45_g6725 [Pleurotus djamor]
MSGSASYSSALSSNLKGDTRGMPSNAITKPATPEPAKDLHAGDHFTNVHGGNNGGRHNNNLIQYGGEDTLMDKVRRARHAIGSMTKRDLAEARLLIFDLEEEIENLSETTKAFKEELDARDRVLITA